MNTIKQYKWHIISVVILTIVFSFFAYRIGSVMERVDTLEALNSIEDAVQTSNDSSFRNCVTEAYEDYSEEWDKECIRNDEGRDCTLGLFLRYDIEADYQDDIIVCLAEFKD